MVTGPFGNFIVPIMVGARDMAFPRLHALSFWLIASVVPVLLSAAFLGGIPTGWTGYTPLADQAPPGMDSYLITIIVFALSSAVAGMNIMTTCLTMRARGMTWNRTPIFVFGVVASVGVAIPAFPMFMTAQVLLWLDRATGATFYNCALGGSPWLNQNLFWLMDHPEVYVILIPALAALLELTPVFARKPLFSFTAAVVGIVGVSVLGMMVWAHHMYASGWEPALNGPLMLTTEIISVPTGALILVFIGTLCGARSGLVSTSPSSACSPSGWPVSRAAWRRTQRCSAKGNLVSTLVAYLIGIGMLVMLYTVVSSWPHGPRAPGSVRSPPTLL